MRIGVRALRRRNTNGETSGCGDEQTHGRLGESRGDESARRGDYCKTAMGWGALICIMGRRRCVAIRWGSTVQIDSLHS